MTTSIQKRTLWHVGALTVAIDQGMITAKEVEGSEFIFYEVLNDRSVDEDEDTHPELSAILTAASDDGRYRCGCQPSRDSQDEHEPLSGLQLFLDKFGFEGVATSVELILFGAPTNFIQEFYQGAGANLRVFGPCGFWSGFRNRWDAGFGNQSAQP
jgi:hypothetical protein